MRASPLNWWITYRRRMRRRIRWHFPDASPGMPGELTYAKTYIATSMPWLPILRVRVFWTIGTSEERRNQVVLAMADEARCGRLKV